MGIKKIIPAIILSLLVVGGFAQQQPSGFPFKISPPLWYEMPWLKTDSGIALASRDTANVRPRFPFSVIGWQRPGLDSSLWFHNGGVWSRIPNANDFTNINTIDVYGIGGQSNGNNSGDTTQSPKVVSGTVFQYSGGNIISGNDPVGSNAAQFGSAWPAFGITYNNITGHKICFVPAAVNATSQTVAANTGAGTWDTTGTLFGAANTAIAAALTKLRQLGYTPIFKGILWVQGENDATAINSATITQATYIAAFRKMIARFRGIYGPRMPFYIFRTGWITNQSQAGFTSIANAQDSVANADSLTNIVYYNAMDFNARGLMKPDFTHYLQPGYNEMGRMGAENVLNSNAYKFQAQAGSIYLPYGNVGIGKSLPVYPLDIVGNQHNVGNLNIIGNITDTGTFSNVNGPFNITSSQININNSLANPIILTNTQSGFVFNKWTNTVTGSNNGIGDAYFADGSSSSFLQLAKASTSNSLFPDGSIVRNSGTGGLWLISDNSPIKFVNGAGFTEYARFTQNGNLLFNTTTDISSSILTIQTTAKGFLPPRMTGAQMNAIVSPVVGLTVFCTDSLAICWYTGSAWVKSGSGGGGGSSGTVTLINTGAGLGGGPITTTGTITLDTGFIYSHEPVDTFYNPRAGDTTVTNPSVRKYLFKSDTAVVGAGIKINPNDSMLLFRADTGLLATQSYVLAHMGMTNPMTTQGDIIYENGTPTPARLAAGTSVQVLHSGTTPSWSAVSLTADVTGTLPIANGGTNATTANTAFNNLVPSQTSNSGKFLTTDGTNTSWATAGGSATLNNKQVGFGSASNVLTGSSRLIFDSTQITGSTAFTRRLSVFGTSSQDLTSFNDQSFKVIGNIMYLGDTVQLQPTFMEFGGYAGNQIRMFVGHLGTKEWNEGVNLNYRNSIHQYYDTAQDIIYTYFGDNGWGVQTVGKGHSNYSSPGVQQDVYNNFGRIPWRIDWIKSGNDYAGTTLSTNRLQLFDETVSNNIMTTGYHGIFHVNSATMTYSGTPNWIFQDTVLVGIGNTPQSGYRLTITSTTDDKSMNFYNNDNSTHTNKIRWDKAKAGSHNLGAGVDNAFQDINGGVADEEWTSTANAPGSFSNFRKRWRTTNAAGSLAERMTLDESGALLINTTSLLSSEKFRSNGDVVFNGNTIQTKSGGTTFPYSSTIGATAANYWQFAYTPTAASFSKGTAIVVDTNNNVAFGAVAPVSTLPGYSGGGLVLTGGSLMVGSSYFRNVLTVASGTTSIGAGYYFISCDASAGNITINLPAASSVFGGNEGIHYIFYRVDATGNTVSVARAGSDTINGTTSFSINTQYLVKQLQCVSTSAWIQY